MKKAVIYVHGKGGNSSEAEHYNNLFADCLVSGFDYASQTPWQAKCEFIAYFKEIRRAYDDVTIIANSIGAYFCMCALSKKQVDRAYFISPVVDMEKLIYTLMTVAGVTEERLEREKEIATDFGETLSYEYLDYVKHNPVGWDVPTHVLYGEHDALTAFDTISGFAEKTGATLTVMKNGEHWFHTDEQMTFLDNWIISFL